LEHQIRFCIARDGSRLAYSTVGRGPALVVPPAWISHQELAWQEPVSRRFCERLAHHHTLVQYDRPGTGLSDRNRTDFSWDSELRDLETVIDHLKLKHPALLGYSWGGPVVVVYTAEHPRRISHLILYDTYARGAAITTDQVKASLISLVRAHWGIGSKVLADLFSPGADAAGIELWAKYQRECATPEAAARILDLLYRTDITRLLPSLRVPTLVLHRQQDRAMPFRLGRELASLIPNARFVPLEGRDHLPWLGDFESVLSPIAQFLGDPVTVGQSTKSGQVVAPDLTAAADDPVTREARSFIGTLDRVILSRCRVVGDYTRYEEGVRNSLKDVRYKIAAGFDSRKRENYLVWGAPGSGKTYFVQQVAASLPQPVCYHEFNLAKCSREEFLSGLGQLDAENKPCLCLVDEVDAKPNEAWPYEVLLPYLDANTDRGAQFVFVLAGSSGSSLVDMKKKIASRPKGADLLTRIPAGNEFEIPPMNLGDRMLVVLSQFRQAGRKLGREVKEVEKLSLYYVALNSRLANARQLHELAVRAIERLPTGEDRIKYDHLFGAGDPENKSFWMQSLPAAAELANRFVTLED
jgi:pimeloyl-ACP methyl ester carboxylesterase